IGGALHFAQRPSLFRLNEHGAFRFRHRILHKNPKPLGDLRIGFDQSAKIAAETILIKLILRFDVPKPAAIGADLIGEHDAHRIVLEDASELDLEIDEPDADAEEKAGQEVVDPESKGHHLVDLLRRRPAERGNMLLCDHWIVQLIGLIIKLYD